MISNERIPRARLVAWLLLGLPLAIYVNFWPVRARLDRAVIERRLAGSIWKQMSESLPGAGQQILVESAFWIGCLAFLLGALFLVWLALAGAGEAMTTPGESDLPSSAESDPLV